MMKWDRSYAIMTILYARENSWKRQKKKKVKQRILKQYAVNASMTRQSITNETHKKRKIYTNNTVVCGMLL